MQFFDYLNLEITSSLQLCLTTDRIIFSQSKRAYSYSNRIMS